MIAFFLWLSFDCIAMLYCILKDCGLSVYHFIYFAYDCLWLDVVQAGIVMSFALFVAEYGAWAAWHVKLDCIFCALSPPHKSA